jgi:hypothetical protein
MVSVRYGKYREGQSSNMRAQIDDESTLCDPREAPSRWNATRSGVQEGWRESVFRSEGGYKSKFHSGKPAMEGAQGRSENGHQKTRCKFPISTRCLTHPGVWLRDMRTSSSTQRGEENGDFDTLTPAARGGSVYQLSETARKGEEEKKGRSFNRKKDRLPLELRAILR